MDVFINCIYTYSSFQWTFNHCYSLCCIFPRTRWSSVWISCYIMRICFSTSVNVLFTAALSFSVAMWRSINNWLAVLPSYNRMAASALAPVFLDAQQNTNLEFQPFSLRSLTVKWTLSSKNSIQSKFVIPVF